MAIIGCGAGTADPDRRLADWEENPDRVNKASAGGQHEEAIVVANAFLKMHPDDVDGHLMAGSALMSGAQAASDHRRPAWFTEAASHYARVLEITRNPVFRRLSVSALFLIYGPQGLNNLAEGERYARLQIDHSPQEPSSYLALMSLLTDQKKFDDLLTMLAGARKNFEPSAENIARYGGFVHDVVAHTPGFLRIESRLCYPMRWPLSIRCWPNMAAMTN